MAPNLLSKTFGEVTRNLRTQAGMSQEVLATRAGLHRTYLGAIERGEKNITLLMASRLAGALDLSLLDLISEVDRIQRPRRTGLRGGRR